MNKKLRNEVEESFKKHFREKPLMIFSPGRINLIGEHVDYSEGFVLPAAINKGIAVAMVKSSSKNSKVYALNKDELLDFNLDGIKKLPNGGWRNYILGVVAEIQKKGLTVGNFNAVFGGNIPEGAGMSSSAALENAFVFGLNKLFNLGLSKSEMILISQQAEHHFTGVKCGIMDQYASMFGVKDSVLLLDCRTLESTTYKIDFKNYKLLLINTNVKHNLAESAYNDRRAVCENVAAVLKIKTLRDASKEMLDGIKDELSEEDYQKALYVIEENERVKKFSQAIVENNLNTLGDLLYKSHEGLRKQYQVSCSELDFLVDKAKENNDVLGARMMGGGFGGCTLNLVKKDGAEDFIKEINKSYLQEYDRACSVYNVKLASGTRILK
ncbi:galactokinase [Kaistella polysaccharea]|uniref:galactokinase n=1 Tax=Kaistella polysaccharea TaxID=2878534 RepID=UPI001CF373E5|nr:galactokinase [Kaistella polysaccharea]